MTTGIYFKYFIKVFCNIDYHTETKIQQTTNSQGIADALTCQLFSILLLYSENLIAKLTNTKVCV